jgi:hypothetical protein
MASYVVMEPPGERGAEEEAVFVRDGFHLLAFIFTFLWLLFHRLWLEGIAVLLIAIVIGWLSTPAMLGNGGIILSLLVSIYVGIEGSVLRIARLRRNGWREWGVVEADNARDAELRYLAEAGEQMMEEAPTKPRLWGNAPAAEKKVSRTDTTALGLLGLRGDR